MNGVAPIGLRGTCPTCGSPEFEREEEIRSGGRTVQIARWDDGYLTVDEESLEWEIGDTDADSWRCANGHEITDEGLIEELDRNADGPLR